MEDLLSVLSFKMEADPGTWCRAGDWDCVFYEEAPEVEGGRGGVVAASAAGTGCWPLPFLEFKCEPEPERDRACPAPWLQGFMLLLKSCTLARCHRSELYDCLVIGDATLPQPSLSPPDTMASHAICHAPEETQHQLKTQLTPHT